MIKNNSLYERIKKEKKVFILSIIICNIIYFININVAKNIYHVTLQIYYDSKFLLIPEESRNDIDISLITEHIKKLSNNSKSNVFFSEVNVKKNSYGPSINYIIKQKSIDSKFIYENDKLEKLVKELFFIDFFEILKKILKRDIQIYYTDQEFLREKLKLYIDNKSINSEFMFNSTIYQTLIRYDQNIKNLEGLLADLKKPDLLNYDIKIITSKYPFFRSLLIHNLFALIISIIFIFFKKNLKKVI